MRGLPTVPVAGLAAGSWWPEACDGRLVAGGWWLYFQGKGSFISSVAGTPG